MQGTFGCLQKTTNGVLFACDEFLAAPKRPALSPIHVGLTIQLITNSQLSFMLLISTLDSAALILDASNTRFDWIQETSQLQTRKTSTTQGLSAYWLSTSNCKHFSRFFCSCGVNNPAKYCHTSMSSTTLLLHFPSQRRGRDPTNPLEYKPEAFVGARERLMMERIKAAVR
jgi:hypothetical protein